MLIIFAMFFIISSTFESVQFFMDREFLRYKNIDHVAVIKATL